MSHQNLVSFGKNVMKKILFQCLPLLVLPRTEYLPCLSAGLVQVVRGGVPLTGPQNLLVSVAVTIAALPQHLLIDQT